ncbi:MAG: hypothetical protein HOO95_08960 [Gallionella sp.]|nr:hypothetical protein [Gallionella sp.]
MNISFFGKQIKRAAASLLILFSGHAYCIEKENLDVNLNPLYLAVKPHKNANVQGEFVFQLPVPVTKKSDETGLGPIAALAYLDSKYLVNIEGERAAVRGLGRLYYVHSAYGTKQTFVSYLTIYRDLAIDYPDKVNTQYQSKSVNWLTPGFLYAYRVNDKVVLHLDAELYSYKNVANNFSKIGANYVLTPEWLVSAAYERLSWDMKDGVNNNISMKGRSDSVYAKFINSNPYRNNFAVTVGYAEDKNVAGSALLSKSTSHMNGAFMGFEISFGTLVW